MPRSDSEVVLSPAEFLCCIERNSRCKLIARPVIDVARGRRLLDLETPERRREQKRLVRGARLIYLKFPPWSKHERCLGRS
jgi:hypothetical protein